MYDFNLDMNSMLPNRRLEAPEDRYPLSLSPFRPVRYADPEPRTRRELSHADVLGTENDPFRQHRKVIEERKRDEALSILSKMQDEEMRNNKAKSNLQSKLRTERRPLQRLMFDDDSIQIERQVRENIEAELGMTLNQAKTIIQRVRQERDRGGNGDERKEGQNSVETRFET
ncbi:uncharacterized protein N7511_008128 [Penicillium nucicola]|uniref:uncharacterized protein n=1 Tax=Penicillium nucicola TaxID=1850975 RepID=UPI002544EC70|nr:uncharacterized protein N7511_008128 [Penicillium nucicola]KAJ5753975.1 hypothetical protein N7511_008128 [Penicillium nucicola]